MLKARTCRRDTHFWSRPSQFTSQKDPGVSEGVKTLKPLKTRKAPGGFHQFRIQKPETAIRNSETLFRIQNSETLFRIPEFRNLGFPVIIRLLFS